MSQLFRAVFAFLFLFTIISFAQKSGAVVSGFVVTSNNNSPLENCNLYVQESQSGATTNSNGYYKIRLPYGNYTFRFSFIGFKTVYKKVTLSRNSSKITMNVAMHPTTYMEDEVTVVEKKEKQTTIIQKVEAEDLQKMPIIYGDVLRSVQVLSGVSSNNELSSGYNVRGGSYDENLIYLNGYEIYRPFLLRQGIEENQSLINQDMVENINFYNGAFPAKFGDKMSSALEVNYKRYNDGFGGNFRADVMNMGITLRGGSKTFNWSVGGRYAYPGAFLKTLQTQGDYKPTFSDIQVLTNYKVTDNSELEFFGVYAENKFDLTPDKWEGHFGGIGRGDFRALTLDYDGTQEYSYYTGLGGLKYKHQLTNDLGVQLSYAKYYTKEKEYRNLTSEVYYSPDAGNPEDDMDYLKTRYEYSDSYMQLESDRLKALTRLDLSNHSLLLGAEYRFVDVTNKIDDSFNENGDSVLSITPVVRKVNEKNSLNSFSLFLEDDIRLSEEINANVGVRYLNYEYTNEKLISPRFNISYFHSPVNSFNFSYGVYYQPPFLSELRDPGLENIKAQKSTHYVLGWEHVFPNQLKMHAEAYYKEMDNIIPFYFERMKMTYLRGNVREGYAYGLDVMVEGEIVPGTRSWIGYSYLDSKERDKGTAKYRRRLYDQTHSLQIFLQDKFKKHPNWQAHTRFVIGSGQLFYTRNIEKDPATGYEQIKVDLNSPEEYLLYLRVDMGCSAAFKLSEKTNLLVVAEVLNMFNQYNIMGYEWAQVMSDIKYAFRIPQILSKRFFNLRVELSI